MHTCHPEIRLAMHFGDLPLPFIGTTNGIEACRRRTQKMFDTWNFPSGKFAMHSIEGDTVRSRLSLTIQHRWTGYAIDTSIRQVFRFESGLIRHFDGYMDAPRFAAFVKFVGIAPSKARAPSAD